MRLTGEKPLTLRRNGLHTFYVTIAGQSWVATRSELELLLTDLQTLLKDDE